MKRANTGAFFGRRDAVKLAHKSFMDAIYQSYVKLH